MCWSQATSHSPKPISPKHISSAIFFWLNSFQKIILMISISITRRLESNKKKIIALLYSIWLETTCSDKYECIRVPEKKREEKQAVSNERTSKCGCEHKRRQTVFTQQCKWTIDNTNRFIRPFWSISARAFIDNILVASKTKQIQVTI